MYWTDGTLYINNNHNTILSSFSQNILKKRQKGIFVESGEKKTLNGADKFGKSTV